VIHRVAGSGRGRTHLSVGQGGCLPERSRATQDAQTPLYHAAIQGHAAVATQLLAAGAAVDAKDEVCAWRGGG